MSPDPPDHRPTGSDPGRSGHLPPGGVRAVGRHDRLRDEHGFVVGRGKPAPLISVFVMLPVGILALLAGIWVLSRWAPGRIRRI